MIWAPFWYLACVNPWWRLWADEEGSLGPAHSPLSDPLWVPLLREASLTFWVVFYPHSFVGLGLPRSDPVTFAGCGLPLHLFVLPVGPCWGSVLLSLLIPLLGCHNPVPSCFLCSLSCISLEHYCPLGKPETTAWPF